MKVVDLPEGAEVWKKLRDAHDRLKVVMQRYDGERGATVERFRALHGQVERAVDDFNDAMEAAADVANQIADERSLSDWRDAQVGLFDFDPKEPTEEWVEKDDLKDAERAVNAYARIKVE